VGWTTTAARVVVRQPTAPPQHRVTDAFRGSLRVATMTRGSRSVAARTLSWSAALHAIRLTTEDGPFGPRAKGPLGGIWRIVGRDGLHGLVPKDIQAPRRTTVWRESTVPLARDLWRETESLRSFGSLVLWFVDRMRF